MVEDGEKNEPGNQTLSVWVNKEVVYELDRKSKELGRTKSWLVNFVLRDRLGLQPNDGFKGKDVL